MKNKTLKLREAHKSSGPSFCSVIFDRLDGKYLVSASSSDTSLAVHDLSNQSATIPKTLRHHRDGITALALSPDSAFLASGSIDHSVKIYAFPSGDFQSNVTRFTLPIRCLTFNWSGSLLAAAGDDDGIKLIATIDSSISRVLKGHKGTVTGLSFDPKNEFLASIDAFGTVIYWELSTGEPLHILKSVSPDHGSDSSILNVVSWRPDGEVLAVPGLKNDVVMYDRDTAEKVFSLKGDHEESVCFFSWSPNGKYMATAGIDRQVLVWDVDLKQDIDRQKFDERISSLNWKPTGNALAVIDSLGKLGIWELPVPSFMKSPTEDVPVLQNKNQESLFFDENDEECSASDDCEDESLPSSHKRLRKGSRQDDDNGYDDHHHDGYHDEDDDLIVAIESRERQRNRRRRVEIKDGSALTKMKTSRMQEAFQPCSTPDQSGKRRFLCYNMLGTITTMDNEGYSHIEVDFHDTGRGTRVPAMTDFFGYTMACLNDSGSVFANPSKGEKSASTLMYRPFCSWANNSEWSMRFEGEEVKVVALGGGWVAAVTDLNFLRIFSEGGLQRHIISLGGPVVTAVGFQDEVAVVTHASEPLPSGDQMLEVRVFNIQSRTQPIRCAVPLSTGSSLVWFGFSEEGHLSSYDSKGVLRVFASQFGGSWLPIFRGNKSEEEIHWVVGLNSTNLFCIVCKSPESYPLVSPKPVLTLLNLSFPVALSDLGADNLESEFIMCTHQLSQIQAKIESTTAAGQDTTVLDDQAFNVEAALDRCILRLIASCCNGDKLVRATELARSLILKKSIVGAIKLVTALKLPNLAERFSSILEERLSSDATVVPSGQNVVNASEIVKPPAPRHENVETLISKSTVSKSATLPTSEETYTDGKEGKEVVPSTQPVRPANPFAKQNGNHGKASLLDSIKKMKKSDGSCESDGIKKKIKA